jgi:hypothetical protein
LLGLYEARYTGFTVKHFHGQLQKRYKLSYTVTRLSLQEAGLVRPAPKRSVHRKKPRRRPLVQMMLHPRYIALRPAAGRCSAIRRSTTRPAQSVRAFSSRRRPRPRAFALRSRRSIAGLPRLIWPARNAAFAVALAETGSVLRHRPRRPGARHPGGTPGQQRQHPQIARSHSADPAEPAAARIFVRATARVH